MGKCNNSDGLIDELIYGLYDIDPDGNLDDVQYLEECKRYLDKKLKEIFENYELNDALYDNIETALIESGINTNDTYFSKENIKRKLEGFNSGVIEEIGVDTSSKLLEVPTTTMEVYNSDFLTDSYGYATDVRLNAEKLFRNLVANYTLIDRENGRVINSATLNSSIQALQQKLFDNIIDYINLIRKRGINTDFENLLKELEDPTTKRIELYKNGEYTHVLEKLRNLIDSQLTMSSDDLIQSNSKMLIGSISNKAKILAYNSRVLLYNFDSYLKLLYGKNIVIKDIGKFKYDDKYTWAIKGVDVNKTWRTSDDINADKEISGVVKLLFNTTRLYTWNNDVPTNKYLKSQDVEYIIAKIKKLGFSDKCFNINFKEITSQFHNIVDELSDETKEILLETETLGILINKVNFNSIKYFSALFEVLSNNNFYKLCIGNSNYNIYEDFKTFDKDVIYSLYKEIFNPVGNKSINAINKQDKSINYYSYITQTLNSISPVQFFQYYQDEDGNYKVRTLLDQSYDLISQYIENSIILHNSKKLNNFDKNRDNYKIEPTAINQELNSISFVVGNFKIVIDLNNFTPQIYDKNTNNKITTLSEKDWNDVHLRQFLDDILKQGLGITSDTVFAKAYLDEVGSKSKAINELMTLATRVLFNAYISNVVFKNINTVQDLETGINSVYKSRNAPKINYNTGEISLVSSKDIRTIKNLALAKASLNGLTTSTIVKTGEGNALSSVTLSRLLGSYSSQKELQCNQDKSVTKDCALVKYRSLLKGIFSTKEIKHQNNIKAYTDFNVGEFAYSSFIFDFLGGLVSVDEQSRHVLGNNVVAFLASCNSDKSEIDKLVIDLNTEINGKKLIDYTSDELETLISNEFGTIYTNIIQKINSDLAKLFNFMGLDLHLNPILDDFREVNQKIREKYLEKNSEKNPYDIIQEKIAEYNQNFEHINFTDQLYFSNNKGNLKSNISLISLIYRFNPEYIYEEEKKLEQEEHYITYNNRNYLNSEQFWKEQNKSIIKDLLNNDFIIDLSKESKETAYLKQNFTGWGTDKMMIAKLTHNGETYPIYSDIDLTQLSFKLKLSKDEILNKLELHPLLRKFNLLNYLIQEEFLITSVGSYINHSSKYTKDDSLVDESLRKKAQNKRNVQLTGTTHEFQLNQLDGIPSEYNVAVVKDIKDFCYNVAGEIEDGVKPYDGATFVNPMIVYLENNSLGAQKVGLTKKPFVHFYNPETGTGGIIKTAGFAITNDTIRNSEMDKNIFKKMSSFKWKGSKGNTFFTDITQVNYGSRIFYKTKNGFAEIKIESILENGKYSNKYKIYTRTVNEFGESDEDFKNPIEKIIDNNYSLWEAFGGERSCELVDGRLEYSENSIKFVVTAMNNLGEGDISTANTQEDFYQPLKHSDIHYVVTEGAIKQGASNINPNSSYYDDTPFNFMKIKMLQAGVQLNKEHHADDSELSLMTQVISACVARGYSFKRANNVFKALANQSKFLSKNISQACYKLIKSENYDIDSKELTKVINKIIIDALASKKTDGSNFAVIIAKDLINKLKNKQKIDWDNDVNIPYSDNTVYNQLLSTISVTLTNSGIKVKIPGILSVLTPSYKRFRLYGDYKLEHFYDKSEIEQLQFEKYDSSPIYQNISPKYNIREDLSKSIVSSENDVIFINRENITLNDFLNYLKGLDGSHRSNLNKQIFNRLQSKYGITDEVLEKIFFNPKNILKFLAYKEKYNLDNVEYKIKYFQEEKSKYQDWSGEDDLRTNWNDEEKLKLEYNSTLYALNKFLNVNISDIEIGRTYKVIINNNGINDIESYTITTPLDYYNFKEKIQSYVINGSDFSIIEDITKGRELASYNTRFQDQSGKKYQLYDLDSCKLLFKLKEIIEQNDTAGIYFLKELYSKEELLNISTNNKKLQNEIELFFNNPDSADINYINTIFTNKIVEILIRRKLQKDLNALSKDHPDNIVYINNKPVVVNKDSIKVNPYEVIMPKIFMHEFGLKKYDELQKIKNDKYFFLKRMMSNFHTKLISEYDFDVELKNNNGEHYYILDSKHLNTVQNIRRADFYYKRNENGKLFRTNDDGTKIFYEISSENDKIYTDNNGVDVIVTDNPEFYINNLHYDLLTFSMRKSFPYTQYMELIKDIESAKESYEYLNTKEKSGLYTVEKLNEILRNSFEIDLSKMSSEQIEDEIARSYPLQLIHKKANYTHTSFLKSLDIIAARIPAQNMQSFMPMRVVGFENPNINNAYVSTTQLWLQGSDYDIDTVSLATFAINKNGKLVLWSPYAKLDSIESLEQSLELPYPTNESFEFKVDENFNLEEFKKFLSLTENAPKDLIQLRYLLENYDKIVVPSKVLFSEIFDNFNYDYEELSKKLDRLKTIINKHNLYLVDRNDIDLIIHNYMMHSLYSIAENPINLLEAQSSVDAVTAEPKQIADEDTSVDTKENSGNFINTMKDINRNQIGKKEVGIGANALKVFFAVSQYYNTVLNSGNSEAQERLLFNSKLLPGLRLIANAHALNIDTVTNERVKEALLSLNQDVDASNSLSAMLSLAVDNAKDPKLSKLNSTIKSMSLYLYGIIIGMDFKSISDLLMSDVGRMMTKLISGNIFNNKSFSFDNLLKYFKLGPEKQLSVFNKQIYDPNSKSFLQSPLSILNYELNNKINTGDVIDFLLSPSFTLDKKLEILDSCLNLNFSNESVKKEYNKLIDFCKEYCVQYDLYYRNQDKFDKIIDLSHGASEITLLSKILGLNKGIPTKQEEIFDLIDSFETCLQSRFNILRSLNQANNIKSDRDLTSNYRVDLLQFVYNEDSRREYIKKYEEYKHSINILDVISTVPHFMQYLTRLADAYVSMSNVSARFRFLKKQGDKYTKYKSKERKQRIKKGESNYGVDYIINSYFLDNNVKFTLPKGNRYYINGRLSDQTTDDMEIYLGTLDGNATFKRWVELSVMPRLNQKIIRGNSRLQISNNFIESLQPMVYTLNVSQNPSINYSLPINMMPRNDSERVLFNGFKSEFNKLYTYSYSETPDYAIPLIQLLFYYNLITYSNRLGESSLTSIFENQNQNPDIQRFYEYISHFDKNGEIPEVDENNLVSSGLVYYITSRDNPYISNEQYLYYKSRKEFITKLYSKKQKNNQSSYYDDDYDNYNNYDDYNNYDNYSIGNYEVKDNMSDPNYFVRKVNSQFYEITLNDLSVNGERISATVQVSGNKITSINGEELTEPIDIPFTKSVNRSINKERLKKYVEYYLTCKK